MIVSRGRRYVFDHIPKTGGTSLTHALEERAMKDDILFGDTPKALKRRNRAKALLSVPLFVHPIIPMRPEKESAVPVDLDALSR